MPARAIAGHCPAFDPTWHGLCIPLVLSVLPIPLLGVSAMPDFPVNPRHAALIAAADDYAMDMAIRSDSTRIQRLLVESPMLSSLPGLTLACDICSLTIEDDISPVLLFKGHVLTASDVLWLVDLGFDYNYLDGITTTPVII